MVCELHLEENHLKENSTILSNIKLRFGISLPKTDSLRKHHKDQRLVEQMTSRIFLSLPCKVLSSIQMKRSDKHEIVGMKRSTHLKTRIHTKEAKEHAHSVWKEVSAPASHIGQFNELTSIPRRPRFHLDGRWSREALQTKILTFFGMIWFQRVE